MIAALLTLVGYSMNDTIVIFDRIRENLQLNRREPLDDVINRSVNQTLSRTIMTSGLDVPDGDRAVSVRRPGAAWFFFRPGVSESSSELILGVHRQPDRAVLARLDGSAAEVGRSGSRDPVRSARAGGSEAGSARLSEGTGGA